MKKFEYKCKQGHTTESVHPKDKIKCKKCGKCAKRIYNIAGIHFKGNGFTKSIKEE